MAAAAAASFRAATTTTSLLDKLLRPSLGALHASLPPNARLLCLDVTRTHVALSVSDTSRTTAFPFGILCRTASPSADARILSSALSLTSEIGARSAVEPPKARQVPALESADAPVTDDHDDFTPSIQGLVINVPCAPADAKAVAVDYARALLQQAHLARLVEDLKACVLYSEAWAWKHALQRAHDLTNAVSLLPPKLENKTRPRFEGAMFPTLTTHHLLDLHAPVAREAVARISSSDVLQAVLDQLGSLDRITTSAESSSSTRNKQTS